MLRQSKTTIKELSAQYRSVLKRAFLAGVICAVSMTLNNANAAINVEPGATDITADVISTIVANANTEYADGSYTPKTWDSTTHTFVDGESTDTPSSAPGAEPTADSIALNLSHGDTDLATYASGYTISDPTADPAAVTVDATNYSYTNTAADGSTSTITLNASDITDTPVLSTDGYDYDLATIDTTNGGRDYSETSMNVSAGAPDVTQYYYLDNDGNQIHFTAETTIEDLDGNAAALDVFTNGYVADKTAYNTVKDHYDASNTAYGAAVSDVNNDQATINAAIETFRNQIGEWSANDQTYNAYTTADTNANAYNNSLANVIDNKATNAANTAEQNAKDYADSLADNYDAAGSADTAEQNAKDYADSLADNYDAAGSADTAEQNAKAYADSLADNYDAAGSADTAEQNAKDYADSLADNYDAAGSADTAEQNAKDYADSLADNYDAAGSADTAEQNAKDYADNQIESEAAARESADNELQTLIATEASTREEKDITLQSNIDAEASARESADADLQDAIDNEVARATTQEQAIRNDFAASDAATLARANAYTDQRVDTLEKNVSGGVAAATALSSVAVSNVKRGEVSVGAGYGYYNDQSAVAFGAAMGLTDRWSVNAGAGLATGDKTQMSFRAGTNYKFKLF